MPLTVEQAETGIYIDFEGEGTIGASFPPALLGAMQNGIYERYVLDIELKLMANPVYLFPEGSTAYLELSEALEALIARCDEEDCLLLSYTEHERNIVEEYEPALLHDFDCVWKNAKLTIKRWGRTLPLDQQPMNNSLKEYMEIAGIEGEPKPENGVPQAIRDLREAFSEVRRWRDISNEDKELARTLVHYNKSDCHGLRELTLLAARELE